MAEPIVKSVDTRGLTPRFMIRVGGTVLPTDWTRLLSRVEYHEAEELATQIVLVPANPNFQLLDKKVFAEGNRIDLWMGYVGRKFWFQNQGFVVEPNPDYPRSEMPTMQIVAHGAERRLMQDEPNGRRFFGTADQIVRQILNEVGISGDLEPIKEKPRYRWIKPGTSKWEFLQNLTRNFGFDLNIKFDDTKLAWKCFWGPPGKREKQDIKFRFTYQGPNDPTSTLLEFHPNISLPSQVTRVEVAYTDPKTRRSRRLFVDVGQNEPKARRNSRQTTPTFSKSGKRRKGSQHQKFLVENPKFIGARGLRPIRQPIGAGPTVTFTVFGQRQEIVADYPFISPADAKRLAVAWFSDRQKDFIFARGVVVGEPSLKRGQTHELKGLGPRLDGDWVLTSVQQTMAMGEPYETEFTATKKVLDSVVIGPTQTGAVEQKDEDI